MPICFDFDLTLTDSHSSGYPNLDTDYFEEESLQRIREAFQELKEGGHSIYIVTRGMTHLVEQYISQPRIGLSPYISKVYGADGESPISGNKEMEGKPFWALKKVEYLKVILGLENAKPEDLYFFDDTALNVAEARRQGFTNSYNVAPHQHGAELIPLILEHVPKKRKKKTFLGRLRSKQTKIRPLDTEPIRSTDSGNSLVDKFASRQRM